MGILEALEDVYYVGIMGFHKHKYEKTGELIVNGVTRVVSGKSQALSFPEYTCRCGSSLCLDAWQMADLPADMRYSRAMTQ